MFKNITEVLSLCEYNYNDSETPKTTDHQLDNSSATFASTFRHTRQNKTMFIAKRLSCELLRLSGYTKDKLIKERIITQTASPRCMRNLLISNDFYFSAGGAFTL